MDPSSFLTDSLKRFPWGGAVARVLTAAILAVEPGAAVHKVLRREGDRLTLGEKAYDLSKIRHVYVIGAGKAGAPMAYAAVEILGDHLSAGIVIVKDGYAKNSGDIQDLTLLEAAHPVPDQRGVQATQRMIRLLQETQTSDLVICLFSGGGSALLVSPPSGISLDDLQSLTSLLLACGASINEINNIRKHLDQVKGGNLARLAAPARVATLILSDVVGDPLDVIASGPTVPDPTTFEQAISTLNRYAILDQTPPAIVEHLERGRRGISPETPKPGESLFENVDNIVIGSNSLAAQAALVLAAAEGFHTLLLTTYLQGEARQAGRLLAAIARQVAQNGQPIPRPACLVAGGETTVTVQGPGKGGRNQELALGAVNELAGLPDIALVTLATDGGDGPTDAAGAVVTGDTLGDAQRLGIYPADFLARNDAYNFFAPLGDLLKPGPTQTNVNDLAFLFAF
jgi:hydroxypyruvate reductase